MRVVPRLRQPLLAAASSAPQCACAAPATLPISAARRALSTTSTLQSNERVRKLIWKDGDAPGPEDPYSPEASQKLRQEQLERDLAEAEAELADYAKDAQEAGTGRELRHRPFSRLKTKNKRTWAPTEKEVEDQGYVPAKTIDDLEEVGGVTGWWDQEGNWGKESEYVGFSARSLSQKVTDKNVCEALVRQAVVETVAVASLGTKGLKGLKGKWAKGDRTAFDNAVALGVKINADGSVAVGGDGEAVKRVTKKLLRPQTKKDAGVVEEILSAEEAKELVESFGTEWKNISLQDPLFKFALHKRVFQLTGQYVHDAKLAQIETVQHLISTIVKPPKPAKVSEAIREAGLLPELPNVRVHDRRVTPIDKETMLGRWKVIKEELEKRNLPVTGHEHLPKPVQRKWIQGRA
ncbi:uncharacterized protein CTRU02_210632 [Colletotrichum truncatum]|uniref:Uncharacterized protein n=1 Tax=Colletotrichum truncatum TaxID=5467 RepID=A0ACC3YPJ3_COLTU|nr:uncharacterized protein CTRU02_03873 [Colletotrichum truncatum]KAF6796895.1 hypothetical protein CTRU02_03873 [Colletotrichum truncatum]